MAHVERRRIQRRDASGRTRTVVHYKVRYRDASGRHHSETKTKLVDAERRKTEIEVALATATWRDPRRGELSLAEWAHSWLPTRLDLRPTTWARLETTMQKQILPYFGSVPLNKITNAIVREWVSILLSSGLSAATTRKAVFALRQCLAAAIADERIQLNPASAVPLPTERQKPPRYLSTERATGTERFERVVLGSLSKVTRPRNSTAVDVMRMRERSGSMSRRRKPAASPQPSPAYAPLCEALTGCNQE